MQESTSQFLSTLFLACQLLLCPSFCTGHAPRALLKLDDSEQRTAVNAALLWRRSFDNVAVDKQSATTLLGPLANYTFLLPVPQLKGGVAFGGTRRRLRRFVRDLLSGHRPIKIGVVGGSISWGQGASNIGVTDWFSVLARWMIETFPAARVTARNGAVPATPSSYMVMCLEQSVDPDVDLVLVEYGLNDGYEDRILDNGSAKPMERLLRRLLAMPRKPAVVMMQVPMYGIAMDADDPQNRPFYFTNEDVDAALAHYYDVPYLSLRTALYRLAAVDRTPGWTWRELFADFHPGDAGFHVMADLVVHLLQSTALEMVAFDPWGADDMLAAYKELPPPMYPGNLPPDSAMCFVGRGFQGIATATRGFTFVNEAAPPAADGEAAPPPPARPGAAVTQPRLKPKWGFVANWRDPDTEPQPRLVIQIDTRRPQALLAPRDAVPVFVLHLRSYKHMGRAELSCGGGCSCAPLVVDALIPERVSQTYLARLNVTQSGNCLLAVTVLRDTSSGERKFKVAGVVISETGGDTTVLERMSDPRTGFFEVGRFHTGDLPMNVYGKADDGGRLADDPGGGAGGMAEAVAEALTAATTAATTTAAAG